MNKKVNEKIALFGAGYVCREAIHELGKENICCIIDNDKQKIGIVINGIIVVSLEEFLKSNQRRILITTYHVQEIIEQLEQLDIFGELKIDVYRPLFQGYGEKDRYISNHYDNNEVESSELEWNNTLRNKMERNYVNGLAKVLAMGKELPLFDHVEIETYNRCNGLCSFCPVNVKNEVRPEKKMTKELFMKIISELSEINYTGKICLFSNNEPFLDRNIVEYHKIARQLLPNARFHLFTNGTLLTVEKFKEIIDYLDELIIDNYNQDLQLNSSVKKIYEYCKNHEELMTKVTICMRKQDEILTSRGGDSPNRKEVVDVSNDRCVMPFYQLIIRPDGKVSLCCNDPLGKTTLGDINNSSIYDIWYGDKHKSIAYSISKGRANFEHCKNCDVFNIATRMKR